MTKKVAEKNFTHELVEAKRWSMSRILKFILTTTSSSKIITITTNLVYFHVFIAMNKAYQFIQIGSQTCTIVMIKKFHELVFLLIRDFFFLVNLKFEIKKILTCRLSRLIKNNFQSSSFLITKQAFSLIECVFHKKIK